MTVALSLKENKLNNKQKQNPHGKQVIDIVIE
jgi:hypothetical protein